jgi:hypothetical protein
MRNVVGLYQRIEDALKAVQALSENGFRKEEMTIIARDINGKYSRALEEVKARNGQDLGDGAAAGAGIGGVLGGIGGLLVGLGALAIPGIGPVIAAGPIVSTLIGAGVGAVAGGLIGMLVDLGIPEEHANVYAEGLRRGGTLLVARTEDQRASQAADIMNRFGPVDLDKKATWWHEGIIGGNQDESPVERPLLGEVLGGQDNQAFQEWSVDYLEVHEQPVVDKAVRIAEEVRVYKEVNERDETVRDTVRRQKVDTKRIDKEEEWKD